MQTKSFIKHIEDLRWVLVRSLCGILIFTALALVFNQVLFDTIIFGPINSNFLTYEIYCSLLNNYSLDPFLCIEKFNFILQNRTMEGQISLFIYTSLTFGFIASFPLTLYQFWNFIEPGLYSNEKKFGKIFIFIASLLFFTGVLFGYFIIVPLSINFLTNFQISAIVSNQIDVSSYISLLRTTLLASGIVFNLPIMMYLLNKLNIVNYQILNSYRKYAYVVMLILSAIITPPDILSQIILVVPLVILYEIGVYVSKFTKAYAT